MTISGTSTAAPARPFSAREAEILELAASGLSDKEIAHRLQISRRTVRTHFERVYRRYKLRGKLPAVLMWLSRQPASEAPRSVST